MNEQDEKKDKNLFKRIFLEYWKHFKMMYPHPVEKMPGSGSKAKNKSIIRIFNKLLKIIIQIIYPTKCLECKKIFSLKKNGHQSPNLNENSNERPLSSYFCDDCLTEITPTSSPMCTMCGEIFKSREGIDHLCASCYIKSKKFNMARAAVLYDGVMKSAIKKFKFNNKLQLQSVFEKMIEETYLKYWKNTNIDIAIPVPLHIKRFRQRGFNQAYLLIKNWNENASMPVVDYNILFRKRNTKPQSTLSSKDRAKNVKNAFNVENAHKIKDKKILLVDDVYTTGSTVNECARELLKNGAERVDILTLARTVYF